MGIDPSLYQGLEQLDYQVAQEIATSRRIDAQLRGIPSRVDSDLAVGNRRIIGGQQQASLAPWGSPQRVREQNLLDAVLRTNIERQQQQVRQNLDDYFSRPFGQDVVNQLETQQRNNLRRIQEQNLRRMQSYERAMAQAGPTASGSSSGSSSAARPPQSPPRSAVPLAPPSTASRPISPLTQAPQRPINLPRPPVTGPNNHPSNRTSNTSGVQAPVSARDLPRQARPVGWLGSQEAPAGSPAPRNVPRRAGNLSPPRSIPNLRPALAQAGALSALDFGYQVAMGEDPRRAALRSGGSLVGGTLGGVLGAPFGGVGGVVGGAVGGLAGGLIGGGIGNLLIPPSAQLQPQSEYLGAFPFIGGQHNAIKYNFTLVILGYQANGAPSQGSYGGSCWGPINSVQLVPSGGTSYSVMIQCRGSGSSGIKSPGLYGFGSTSGGGGNQPVVLSANFSRVDGQPDTAGNPPRNEVTPIPPDLLTRLHPQNTPYTDYYPSPGLADNGSPRGDGEQWIPAAVPAPRQDGQRDPRPSPLPTPEPAPSPGNRPTGGTSTGGQAGSISSNAPNGVDEATPSLNDEFGIEPQRFNFPIGVGAVPFAIMRPTRTPQLRNADRPGTQPQPVNAPPPPPANSPGSPCGGSPCGTAIRQDLQTQRSQLDRLNAGLNAADLAAGFAGLDDIRRKLDIIDNKLGSQIPNGGISGFVQQMQNYAQRAWKATQLDKVINALTLITTLHNAAMLSREIGETLGEVTSQALAAIGIKDEENSPLNINEIIADGTENLIKRIIGEDVYNDVSLKWQKANRVISSATNIVWTLRSIQDSTMEITEWVAENTGRIGNALKRWGVVGDRAYPWMAERIRSQDKWRRRFDRAFQLGENLEDAASSFGNVTSEILNAQEELGELGEARTRFSQSLVDFAEDEPPPEPPPDFVPIASAATDSAIASLAPTIKPPDATRSPTQPTPEEQEAIDNG